MSFVLFNGGRPLLERGDELLAVQAEEGAGMAGRDSLRSPRASSGG